MHSYVMIFSCAALLYPSTLGVQFMNLPRESEGKHYDFNDTIEKIQNDTLHTLNDSYDISRNDTKYRNDQQRLEIPSSIHNISEIFRSEEFNSTIASSSPVTSTKDKLNTQSTQVNTILTEIFSDESNSTSSVSDSSGSPSSSTTQAKSNMNSTTSINEEIIMSSTADEEQEGVVLVKPSSTESTNSSTSKPERIYQKVWAMINDTYTLSILLPIAAGVIFAATIIVTIATCRCVKRKCRRTRLRRKTLPDSVKNLRPSDRARLLAETSDEEF